MKKRTPRQISTLYLGLEGMSQLFGGSFHGGIYMDFLMHNLHDYFLANAVNVAFFVTLFVAEIPTGAYADTFGRKASYVLASFLWSLGLIIYGVSHTFWGFVLAECILAIGSTCVSGAFEAWLVDSLKHTGMSTVEADTYKTQLFARENTVNTVASIVGSVVGAWVYTWSPAGCWITSGILMLGHAGLSKYLLSEDYFVKKDRTLIAHSHEVQQKIKTSLLFVRKNTLIKTIAIFATIQTGATMSANMLWQPFFKEHVPVFWLGTLLGMWMVCGSIGAELSPRLLTTGITPIRLLRISLSLTGVLIVLSAICPFPLSLIMFTLSQVPRGVLGPIFRTTIHSAITDSETRATTVSCATMARHIGGAIGLLLSGISAKYAGIPATWIWSGMLLIIGSWWLSRKYEREQK